MAITREQIEARLADLRVGLAKLQSDATATAGAVQDCEFWLTQTELDTPSVSPAANTGQDE